MPIAAPQLTFHADTGMLFLDNHAVTGIASQDMVAAATFDVSANLQERIDELGSELHELQQLRNIFTADFARELVKRCERFVDNQELTGMTDEEFEAEIGNLLLSGGV